MTLLLLLSTDIVVSQLWKRLNIQICLCFVQLLFFGFLYSILLKYSFTASVEE